MKKLHCKLAEYFTIEELEEVIGPLEGEKERMFFNDLKSIIANTSPKVFLNYIRVSLITYETTYENHLSFFFDKLWDDESSLFAKVYMNGKTSEITRLVKCRNDVVEKVVDAIIDLGYIRRDFMGGADARMSYILLDYEWFIYHYLFENDGWYETYEINTEFRIKEIMKFLKKRLTSSQYEIYRFNVLSGELVYVSCYNDNVKSGRKMTPSDYLPYSKAEYELLYAACNNVDRYSKEIFDIIVS